MPYEIKNPGAVDSGAVCLAMLARLFELPADVAQIKHELGKPGLQLASDDLLLAAKQIGLKAKRITCEWARLDKLTLPAIGRHKDGHFFLLAKITGDQVLIHDPLEQRPMSLPRAAFEHAWSGELILMTRRAGVVAQFREFDFSWFLPEIVRHKALLGEVLIASLFIQILALVSPLFFQAIIDKVMVHRGLTTLDVLALGLLVVSTFEILLGVLRSYLFSHTAHRIDVKLGANLFRHLLALPLAYFESRRIGDSVARVRELEGIRQFLTGSALTAVVDFFFTFVFLGVMYYFSPLLTAIVVGSIPLYIALSIGVTPVLRKRLHDKFNRGAESQAFLVESVNGIQTLKAMAVEPQMRRRWEEQLAEYVRSGFRAEQLSQIAGQGAAYINKFTYVLLLWFGARMVIDGDLTVGGLVAFTMLAGRVSAPVLRIMQLWQDFQQAGISVQRLGDILDTRPEPGYNPNRAALPAIRGQIAFDQVTFRYRPGTREVLRGMSIDVPAGQIVGIVGRSGSGKSTLTKLVQRLYVPESGRVLVDGIDLALVDTAWLRRQIGVVLQDSFLFNRSVRENIALSDPGIGMDAVICAAKLAGAHDFILELSEGYDTVVGERGSSLSGGQRQRIAIARALITNPRILILDEATSALDYESERIIQQNMRDICKGRTVLIIAHRLSALNMCSRILVVEQGQIVEEGAHADLLKRDGYYTRLYQTQAGHAVSKVPEQTGSTQPRAEDSEKITHFPVHGGAHEKMHTTTGSPEASARDNSASDSVLSPVPEKGTAAAQA